jgi:hypothetical protein
MLKKYYKEENKNHCSAARTLSPDYIGNNKSGWFIEGVVQEDYYEWVNGFTAYHPTYGIIFGDFENIVSYPSREALEHFLKHHPFEEWDYYDI